MTGDWPKIKACRTTTVSPWMQIIEREVEFSVSASPQSYHAVSQQDYHRSVDAERANSDSTAVPPGTGVFYLEAASGPGR